MFSPVKGPHGSAPVLAAALAVVLFWGGDARADDFVGTSPELGGSQLPAHVAEAAVLPYELGGVVAYTSAPIRGGTSPFGAGFGGRLGASVSDFYFGIAVVGYLGGTDVDASESAVTYGGEMGYGLRLATFGPTTLTLRPSLGVGGVTISRTDPTARAVAGASAGASTTSTASVSRTSATHVDVVSGATPSQSSGSTGSSGGTGTTGSSAAASDTTHLSNLYVQPGATLMLASGIHFFAINANVLIVPGISYSGETTTWISSGVQAQLGVRW
jgi:hypothetical protein